MNNKKNGKIKNAIAILIAVLLIYAAINVGFAIATYSDRYDIYTDLIAKTDDQLINLGFTNEEITVIRNMNYNSETKQDKSSLDFYIRVCDYGEYEDERNGILRYVDLECAFMWYRMPIAKNDDVIFLDVGSSTTSGYFPHVNFAGDSSVSSDEYKMTLNYVNAITGEIEKKDVDWHNDDGIYCKFSLMNGALSYCQSGKGKIRLICSDMDSKLYVCAAYGHNFGFGDPLPQMNDSGAYEFSSDIKQYQRTAWFNKNFTVSPEMIYNDGRNGVFGFKDTGYITYFFS